MTDYFLMSVEDPKIMENVARRLGVAFLDKAAADFRELGRRYGDNTVYIFEPTAFGEFALDFMKRGAAGVGKDEPRFSLFRDYSSIVRAYTSQRADVVIAAYAKGNGEHLINELRFI